MIGLERGTVKLAPYTAEWKRLFEEERSHLQAVLGANVLDIQHVGSTSIPRIVAKPIIDIAIAVESFERARVCVKPIEGLGYEYIGEHGIPRRHFFVKGNPRAYHVHMNEISGRDWENQVLFRDYLLQHPAAAREYTALKVRLAEQFPFDREAYTDGKAPFIERILGLARSENACRA